MAIVYGMRGIEDYADFTDGAGMGGPVFSFSGLNYDDSVQNILSLHAATHAADVTTLVNSSFVTDGVKMKLVDTTAPQSKEYIKIYSNNDLSEYNTNSFTVTMFAKILDFPRHYWTYYDETPASANCKRAVILKIYGVADESIPLISFGATMPYYKDITNTNLITYRGAIHRNQIALGTAVYGSEMGTGLLTDFVYSMDNWYLLAVRVSNGFIDFSVNGVVVRTVKTTSAAWAKKSRKTRINGTYTTLASKMPRRPGYKNWADTHLGINIVHKLNQLPNANLFANFKIHLGSKYSKNHAENGSLIHYGNIQLYNKCLTNTELLDCYNDNIIDYV